jgi:hypothetical protein
MARTTYTAQRNTFRPSMRDAWAFTRRVRDWRWARVVVASSRRVASQNAASVAAASWSRRKVADGSMGPSVFSFVMRVILSGERVRG